MLQVADFKDEIISIEPVGLLPTVDISVDGDHYYFCNGILTHNSFGLPATADFMFALISDDNLQQQNQFLIKILKNRYNDVMQNRKFLIGVDRSRMKLYNINESEQRNLSDANHTDERPAVKSADFSGFKSASTKRKFKF